MQRISADWEGNSRKKHLGVADEGEYFYIQPSFDKNPEIMIEIPVISDTLSPQELESLLLSENGMDDNFSFKILEEEEGHKDTAVVVSFIAGALPLMGVLVAQIVNILLKVHEKQADQKMNKIVIKGKSGRTIEIPVNSTNEEIEKYLALAKRIDDEEESIKYIATISK